MTLSGYYFAQFSAAQYLDFCFRLLLAFVIGGFVGLERSNRFKEAGVRTHIMVCVTTTLIMLISKYGFADMDYVGNMDYFGTKGADAARVAAQAGGEAESAEQFFDKAAEAAMKGAESTKNFTAKYGRAKSYGEKTLGTEDAGALSMACFFKGMAE